MTLQAPGAPSTEGSYRWYVLAVLICVYMLHHLDRVVFSLLQEPIKHEFNLSDSQLALISGAAYAISFGIAGIPMGLLADRVHRVRLLATLLTIWSGLTALASTASGFIHLLLIRVGVGTAESGSTPTNLSLVSDYFATKRSTAIGLYMMGPQLGTLIGFAITGLIASHYGWRAALLVAGLPGLMLMVILLATVREPRRQMAAQELPPLGEVFRYINAKPALWHIIAATTVANVVAPGVSIWMPSLLMRADGLDIGVVGIAIALTAAPLGILGTVLAGLLTEKYGARQAMVARFMAVAAFLTIPAIVIGVAFNNPWVMIAGFCVHVFAHMFVSTPGYALSMDMVPANLRGATAAVLQVLANLIGFGVGPLVGGLLSDLFEPYVGRDSLRYALGIFVFLSLWACYHHLRAAALLDRARDAESGAPAPA